MDFFSSKNTQFILLGIVLILTIIASMLNTTPILPYSPSDNFSHFEPFSQQTDTPTTVASSSHPPSSGLVVPATENALRTRLGVDTEAYVLSNAEASKLPKTDISTSSNIKEPFALSPALVDSSEKLDRFSGLKGSNTCEPSPYSNSTGYVCMTNQDKNILFTRGGNQTGGV